MNELNAAAKVPHVEYLYRRKVIENLYKHLNLNPNECSMCLNELGVLKCDGEGCIEDGENVKTFMWKCGECSRSLIDVTVPNSSVGDDVYIALMQAREAFNMEQHEIAATIKRLQDLRDNALSLRSKVIDYLFVRSDYSYDELQTMYFNVIHALDEELWRCAYPCIGKIDEVTRRLEKCMDLMPDQFGLSTVHLEEMANDFEELIGLIQEYVFAMSSNVKYVEPLI